MKKEKPYFSNDKHLNTSESQSDNKFIQMNISKDWEEVQRIIKNIYGEWNDITYEGAISQTMPNTAILGNGDVGVTSYGSQDTKEYLLSKGDFWSAGTLKNDGSTTLIALGGVKISGSSKEVKSDAVESREGGKVNWDQSSLNASFYERLNILKAQIETEMTIAENAFSTKAWQCATENTFIVEVQSLGHESIELEVVTWMKSDATSLYPVAAGKDVHNESVWVSRQTDNRAGADSRGWISEAVFLTKVIGAKQVYTAANKDEGSGTIHFTINPQQKIYIVTAVGGGGQTYDSENHLLSMTLPLEEAEELSGAHHSSTDLLNLYEEHLSWWKKYWLQSYISFDETSEDLQKILRYYYGSQYILGATTREGKVAPGLYGVWRTTDDPMWSSDYHLNYNFIGTVYGTYSSNRPELALPMIEALWDYMPEGERHAREDMALLGNDAPPEAKAYIQKRGFEQGINGAILYPVGIGPFGVAVQGDKFWGQTINATFSGTQFIAYYQFTQDKQFLFKRLYPYFEKLATFYEAWLEKEMIDEENYTYVVYDGYHEGTFAKNSGVTLGLVWAIFDILLEAVERFGREKLKISEDRVALWKDIIENLSEIPTIQKDGKKVYALADNGDFWPESGNVELEFIHPAGRLGFCSEPEKLKIAHQTLETKRDAFGQANNTPKAYTQAARVGFPAEEIIKIFLEQTYPQMEENFRINDGVHGIEKVGGIEAFNSMLLQSHDGVVKVFPNWVQNKDATFIRLRAKGAFVISSSYCGKTNEVLWVDVMSEKENLLKLINPWKNREALRIHRIDEDEKCKELSSTIKGNIIEVSMKEGEIYRFSSTNKSVS